MASRHWIRLPDHIIRRVIDWVAAHPPIINQYTSHGIEKRSPEDRANDKLCEFAFAQWAGVDDTEIVLGATDDTDVATRGIRVDVKSCVMSHSLLCWPFNKPYDSKDFDRLVLVKHILPRFLIVGWITKARFRSERLIANDKGTLTEGTWCLEQGRLDSMDKFYRETAHDSKDRTKGAASARVA